MKHLGERHGHQLAIAIQILARARIRPVLPCMRRLMGQNSNPLRKGLPKILPSQSKLIDQYVDEMGGDRPIYR